MDTILLTHRKQIRKPIHHGSKANISSSKLRIDILFKLVPNLNLDHHHKPVMLLALISIILILILIMIVFIIAIAVVILLRMDRRTTITQDYRAPIHISIILNHIFLHTLPSRVLIRRGHRFRMYRAYHPIMKLRNIRNSIRQHRSTAIGDAVIQKDQIQGYELLVAHQAPHRDVQLRMHHRLKVVCSKFHWSTLLFADTVIA
jgi:hypothetical protein